MPCKNSPAPLSSVLLCSSVLDHPDSELISLCLNRLAWGGLDVAVVPDSCKGATYASPHPAAHAQTGRPESTGEGQRQPFLPTKAHPATQPLPSHVKLLSAPQSALEASNSSSDTDTCTSLHAWLACRTPKSVLAVSSPATPLALLSSLPAHALGASWRLDPASSPSSTPPKCEQHFSPAQNSTQSWAPAAKTPSDQLPGHSCSEETDTPNSVSSTLPCLSHLPQRIAHHQYFQHLSPTHGKDSVAAQQCTLEPKQGPADAARTRTSAAEQGSTEHGEAPLLIVGYVMKASRELAMAKCTPSSTDVKGTTTTTTTINNNNNNNNKTPDLQADRSSSSKGSVPTHPSATNSSARSSTGGLLSLVPCSPTDHAPLPPPAACPRLVFAPLELGRPLDEQMPFHAILHKASDELEWSSSEAQGMQAPCFSKRIQALRAWLACHPHVPVIDPFESTEKVIDRLQLCALTGHLNTLDLGQGDEFLSMGRPPMCLSAASPKYCTLWSLDASTINRDMKAAGLTPPLILKPSVACGLPESHSMALVTAPGGEVVADALRAAHMPLPAVAQQFSNHGGRVAKVYAAGDKVFYTIRPSIPDIPEQDLGHHATQVAPVHPCSPTKLSSQRGFHLFDSLKSLPTASSSQQTQQPHGNHSKEGLASLDELLRDHEYALQAIARHLRAAFGLTLFGFDIILVPERSGGGKEGRPAGMDGQAYNSQGDSTQQLQADDTRWSRSAGVGSQREEGDVCGYQLVVIDVNYFPSYSSPGAAVHVWQAMLDRILQ